MPYMQSCEGCLATLSAEFQMQYTTWMEHALWTYVLPMCPPSRTQCSHGMCSHPWENLVTELCWGQYAVPAPQSDERNF